MSAPVLSYAIDEDDRLVEVDDGYYRFAEQNGWAEADASLGRSLWMFVAGEEMRRVQRILLRRLRQEMRGVELPFRCDGPDLRREMTIRIAPRRSGRVVFHARPLAETPREPQPLLDPQAKRGEGLLTMCGWCDRFLVDGEWVEVEVAAERLELFRRSKLPATSHGICSACSTQLLAS